MVLLVQEAILESQGSQVHLVILEQLGLLALQEDQGLLALKEALVYKELLEQLDQLVQLVSQDHQAIRV